MTEVLTLFADAIACTGLDYSPEAPVNQVSNLRYAARRNPRAGPIQTPVFHFGEAQVLTCLCRQFALAGDSLLRCRKLQRY